MRAVLKMSILSLAFLPMVVFSSPNNSDVIQQKVKPIELRVLGTYSSGIIDDSAAEIVAYDAKSRRLFVTNASEDSIDIISIRNPRSPRKISSIDLSPYGSPNSVAVKRGIVAVAVEAPVKQDLGSVLMFDRKGRFLKQLTVGSLPDMLTFTPDGSKIIVANEGEPNDDYTVDPEGSISVIEVSRPIRQMTQAAVTNLNFNQFDNQVLDDSLRIFGPNASVSQDLEPEYITVSKDSKTAWVTLQENNGLAVVDLQNKKITQLVGLGTKSFDSIQTAMDASDKDDVINIKPWPVKGFYQPDSITSYEYDGQTFLITANEGDARDYDGFSEEDRVDDLVLDSAITDQYPNIQDDEQLGRLKTTTVNGDTDQDGDVDQIFAYGARSFSIWDAAGNIVYDSGSDFARITASIDPRIFNGGDKRSDDKGAEPEAVTVGKVAGQTYAFIGLERTGGIMVYNVTDPLSPYFVQYINNTNPEGDVDLGTAGDVAPEGIVFIPQAKSPIRAPLLAVTNEVSGTTTLYKIERRRAKRNPRFHYYKSY